ncbi:MAG: hypothetical protein QGG42_04170, partial [Phycisphaerae bacterium]|nr:hypothetical protein [Phycisphaerae bacterium]
MGKVLKILGVVFLVVIAGIVALMFWAHGEGQAQQRRFFDAVASGDPDKLIAMLDPASIGPVDPPILKMWMDRVNDKLGKYEGLAASNFNPGFPGLGFVLGYNRASFDRINKGFPQDQRQQNWRIQWVKAARMPFA